MTETCCEVCRYYAPSCYDWWWGGLEAAYCQHPKAMRFANLKAFPFKKMCKYGEMEEQDAGESGAAQG